MTDTDTVTAEQAVTVTIPAPKLREMLTAALPHAGTDDTLPSVNAVSFEVQDGVFYLAATDRYSMAVARRRIPGSDTAPVPDVTALLPLLEAQTLQIMLEDETDVAAIVFGDGKLTVDALGAVRTWDTETRFGFPDWRKLTGRLLAAESGELGDYAIDAVLLARLAAGAGEFSPWDPKALRVRIARAAEDSGPALVVTRSDWFLAAIMSIRVNQMEDETRSLPQWESWQRACAAGVKS